jgi:hypothetical protein
MLSAKFATDITVEDNPLDGEPRDGMPGVNHPVTTAGAAPLPAVIGP